LGLPFLQLYEIASVLELGKSPLEQPLGQVGRGAVFVASPLVEGAAQFGSDSQAQGNAFGDNRYKLKD
jgi:hypothetical protein